MLDTKERKCYKNCNHCIYIFFISMLIVVKHFEKYRHGKDDAEVAHTRWTTDNPTVRILS